MGWTSYHATNYKKDKVDRKAECEACIDTKACVVIKSRMIGSTYYAAVKVVADWNSDTDEYVPIPEDKQYVFGAVILTKVNHNDYFNFSYKTMDETCLPYYFDCPMSILNLLSPTDNEYANNWRNECLKKAEQKKLRKKLIELYGQEVV